VNWAHLKTFLWLRWRLVVNRNRRAGSASVILQTIFTIIMLVVGVVAFIAGVLVGALALPKASPGAFMLAWDGVVVAFVLFWMGELLVELQRSELLSLEKFLHLPVSLGTAFLINYIGSLSSVGALLFLPLMLGLAIGLVFGKGPSMLLLFPLIAAFALMVTALTHQFRGWLASLMVNQRRRRTIISVATLAFILLVQTPNLIGFLTGQWGPGVRRNNRKVAVEVQKLDQELAEQKITLEEHDRRVRELRGPAREDTWQNIQQTARVFNQVIPLGWLPYGAAEATESRFLPGFLAIAGLTLIGAASLRRSYTTTLRLYTGQFNAGSSTAPPRPVSTSAPAPRTVKGSAAFLEKSLPWLSEQASAIAFANFRAITRAPEAKLMLLSPIMMVVVFGGMFFRSGDTLPPELVRPLMASGAFAFIFLMMLNMMGNQFSFDRTGFRTFVLSPAPRKDILLGKNLSMAPFMVGFMLIVVLLFQYRFPMRLDHLIALVAQMIPMYLVFCLIGNMLSIIAPMPTASGSMKPVKPKAVTILIHVLFVFIFPLGLAPTLIPLGIEFLLSLSQTLPWFPVYMVLAIVECALVLWLYPLALKSQGEFLQRRERRILEIVTTKTE
jgi:hypothetical protein